MKRIVDLLHESNQFLGDNETIIYIKNNQMSILNSNEYELAELSGEIYPKLQEFMEWFKEHLKDEEVT